MSQRSGGVCLLPHVEGLGGPASFYARLAAGLEERHVTVLSDPLDPACRAILVIGGTRRVLELLRAKRRGIRIVQRLNGMNWIHRRRFTGVRHFIRSEANNLLLSFIRGTIAGRIIYQSNFARTWWQTVYHKAAAPSKVIYNGVDLGEYNPQGSTQRPEDRYRVLLVEGRLGGGNEDGLRNGVALARLLNERLERRVEIMVVGDVPAQLKAHFDGENPGLVTWAGVQQRQRIPEIDRSAHVLFSADLNAACPNSVIEALACGLPVVSYATGSLPELIEDDSGLVVPWGSNFWKLETPDLPVLADAAQRIFQNQAHFRLGARKRAEAVFGVDRMVEQYLEALLGE